MSAPPAAAGLLHERFADFEAEARAQGYDEVLLRDWAPGLVLEAHRHPFALRVQLVRGDFWLGTAQGEVRLQAPTVFELPREAPHSERYGPEGATVWIARRHAEPPLTP